MFLQTRRGWGNEGKAKKLFRNADAIGNHRGTCLLAQMFVKELGSEKRTRQAKELLTKADASGDLKASVHVYLCVLPWIPHDFHQKSQ